ncbi:MAG: hypothetical protein IJC11_04455 [Alphaproteobacteria bacterium]|nr:hypothetical protein [Alphaproteobacteria bacterium]MBQ3117556.1 hypothetical protein [Alphaproteobacteria bacterium]MBQ6855412.1 hypothetical protein [Alphaproteobacteria bacterium]MBR3913917.1 hypothetical protein [Alphaproteobacteria bacterium]
MVYISKQLDACLLPDGTVATSVREIEAYLKRNGLALAGDYSPAFLKSVRDKHQKALHDELFNLFIQNYQRKLWNEK